MAALADGGVTIKDMGVLAAGNLMSASAGIGQQLQKQIGQTGIPVYNVANACATQPAVSPSGVFGIAGARSRLVVRVSVTPASPEMAAASVADYPGTVKNGRRRAAKARHRAGASGSIAGARPFQVEAVVPFERPQQPVQALTLAPSNEFFQRPPDGSLPRALPAQGEGAIEKVRIDRELGRHARRVVRRWVQGKAR